MCFASLQNLDGLPIQNLHAANVATLMDLKNPKWLQLCVYLQIKQCFPCNST